MAEAAEPTAPVPFLAAAAALETVNQAVKDAWKAPTGTPTASSAPATGPRPALAALLMLREVREQLAGWEAGLIENARGQGAGWAYLAGPLGVPAPHGAGEQDHLVGVLFGEPATCSARPAMGTVCGTTGRRVGFTLTRVTWPQGAGERRELCCEVAGRGPVEGGGHDADPPPDCPSAVIPVL